MNLLIENKTHQIKDLWFKLTETFLGEYLDFYVIFEKKPEIVYLFELKKRVNKEYFCFDLDYFAYERINPELNSSYSICPFCNKTIHLSATNCEYLKSFVPEIIKQLVDMPPIRLKILPIKNYIDYNNIKGGK